MHKKTRYYKRKNDVFAKLKDIFCQIVHAVTHAYFLGANNPYESLKKTLNA